MRNNKFVGVGLLVVVLAVVGGVAGFGTSANTDVRCDFAIPSYIAISAEKGAVDMDSYVSPYLYEADNTLHVLSTTNWTVSDTVEWNQYPEGFNPDGEGANLFTVSYDSNSGTWGYADITTRYELDFGSEMEKMQYFPAGDYSVSVTHTATTNSGS